VVGELIENPIYSTSVTLKNPVMAIPQQHNMALIPFLALMEENTITLKEGEYQFGGVFTPTVDLRNHYNKMFGKIEEVSVKDILSFT
jgi:hypothetical protein